MRAAMQDNSTIPIIATTPDRLASGFVASLARPGGNRRPARRAAEQIRTDREKARDAVLIGLIRLTGEISRKAYSPIRHLIAIWTLN
jgi:hypothetical protein